MRLKHFITASFLFAILFAIACNTNTQKKVTNKVENLAEDIVTTAFKQVELRIVNPLPEIKQNIEKLVFDTKSEKKHQFSDGTSITIPAESFVDSEGNPVKGEVNLKYKSIKSPAEIIASGLHLMYNENGEMKPFTTGGMFELTAEADGKQLSLKKGAEISVNYSSIDSSNYNLYVYDQKSNEWTYINEANNFSDPKAEDEVYEEKHKEELKTSLLKPVKMDTKNDFIILVKINHKHLEELTPYDKIMWKYTGNKSKEEVTRILKQQAQSVKLERVNKKEQLYKITLNLKTKKESIQVSPVFTKAEYNKAIKKYTANTTPQKTKKTSTAKGVKRPLTINRLGYYNLDICSNPNVMALQTTIKFNDASYNEEAKKYHYFVISNAGQMITRYNFSKSSSNIMVFYKNTDNKVLAVLPDKKVAYLSKDGSEEINLPSGSKHTLELTVLDQKITSTEQLNEIIAGL